MLLLWGCILDSLNVFLLFLVQVQLKKVEYTEIARLDLRVLTIKNVGFFVNIAF